VFECLPRVGRLFSFGQSRFADCRLEAARIRVLLLNSIQEIEPILKEAPDETVYALNLDLFGIRKLA
jgi:hypothetical protein